MYIPTSGGNKNLTGFYGGLHGRYGFTEGKVNNKIINFSAGEPDLLATHNRSVNMKGVLGSIHVGYQHEFCKYLLGLDVSSTYSDIHKHKKSSNNYDEPGYLSVMDIKVKSKKRYESALRLGAKIEPQLIAGIKLGYARNCYIIQHVNHVIYNPNTTIGQPVKKKINFNSIVTGIYAEKFLNNHVVIGAEYDYTLSKKKTLKGTYMIIPPGLILPGALAVFNNTTFSFKPNTHNIKIRLGYKF